MVKQNQQKLTMTKKEIASSQSVISMLFLVLGNLLQNQICIGSGIICALASIFVAILALGESKPSKEDSSEKVEVIKPKA